MEGKLSGEVFPVFVSDDGNIYGIKMSERQAKMFDVCMMALFKDGCVVDHEKIGDDRYAFRIDRPERMGEKKI